MPAVEFYDALLLGQWGVSSPQADTQVVPVLFPDFLSLQSIRRSSLEPSRTSLHELPVRTHSPFQLC
jgi:hypothetical protein